MSGIDTFEEAKTVSQQLNVLIQTIYMFGLTAHDKDILTGMALNLSCELHLFCEDGFKKELANEQHP